jgi:hypothetical protein
MWVIFDHLRPSGHMTPDHVGDRGAVRLDLGGSRLPTYQPDPVDARRQNDLFGAARLMIAVEPSPAQIGARLFGLFAR